MIEKARRAADKGVAAAAAHAAKTTSRTFWGWVKQNDIDSLAVIGLTLWITFDVIQWAKDFADTHYQVEGLQIAAIIGAVLTPWGLMQAALFKFYADLKVKPTNGNGAV